MSVLPVVEIDREELVKRGVSKGEAVRGYVYNLVELGWLEVPEGVSKKEFVERRLKGVTYENKGIPVYSEDGNGSD